MRSIENEGLPFSRVFFFHLKLHPTLIRWITSYFSDKNYKIFLDNHLSDSFTASSGVPQCSHLVPLLFLRLINYLKLVTENSQVLIFSDDVKLFRKIKSIIDYLLSNTTITPQRPHIIKQVGNRKSLTSEFIKM